MRYARPIVLFLTAFFIAACSSGVPQSDLDGPTTVITVAAASSGVSTLGVPFVDGVPVVEDVAVTITAANGGQPIELSFTLDDGVYSYDPDGLVTTIEFPFTGDVSVALPAGNDYGFETTGTDGDDVWIVYGVTNVYVDFTTSSVRLALQTLIQAASLDTATAISAVVPGERVDLFLTVTAPGGYAVPISDYTVEYVPDAGDGVVTASSNLGARVTATVEPGDDTFRLTATISGWFDDKGVATWMDAVVATYEMPFSISAGFGFDASAPTVTMVDVGTATVGSEVELLGTAEDDVGVDRVQLFEGPELVGSSDPDERVLDGVASITLIGTAWSTLWTPADVGSYAFTVVAVDAVGNEGRSSRTIEVIEPLPTTLTFVSGAHDVPVTLTAGAPVILTGATFSGWDVNFVYIEYYDATFDFQQLSTASLVVVDGMWELAWTAPAAGAYTLYYDYWDGETYEFATFALTVQ